MRFIEAFRRTAFMFCYSASFCQDDNLRMHGPIVFKIVKGLGVFVIHPSFRH